MREFINRRLIKPLLKYLNSGMSPAKLALGMAWGLLLGIIPLIGVNTLLCLLVAFVLRINIGVIQLVNYIVYPLQLLLFVPFVQSGIYIFGVDPLPYPIDEIWGRLQIDFVDTAGDIWMANMMGVLVWLTISPLIYASTYYGSHFLIKKLRRSKEE